MKAQLKQEKVKEDKAKARALESEQLALKILANATSYGIFIELNVEDMDEDDKPFEVHTGQGSFTAKPRKRETPGEYFHPLLATLITGAARLMMAITERLILDKGLDWGFCDTDGIAIALPTGQAEEPFESRVQNIRSWFEGLNPYDAKGSILDLEDENYSLSGKWLEPLYCFAVSAKRYALFNRGPDGELTIRKASAHGLGHLLPPYSEGPHAPTTSNENEEKELKDEDEDEGLVSGVELWHKTYGAPSSKPPKVITLATSPSTGTRTSRSLPPAATPRRSPRFLDWFKAYNKVSGLRRAGEAVQLPADVPGEAAGRPAVRRPRPDLEPEGA